MHHGLFDEQSKFDARRTLQKLGGGFHISPAALNECACKAWVCTSVHPLISTSACVSWMLKKHQLPGIGLLLHTDLTHT